ncbi:hypothetical protein [Flavihumibacter petaseus]|uniref:Uncharacterized protein n=1 Tax=Flavihumibacter petaseus NBRC 106054 TaxID=1220578 RepID=A0A0E9MYG9_9BACT|nr:hypothetical protein [Flavihumibacter petaseus]GAO42553.1 hypothetical protein FPE01S_01_15680 [Flavihumibacter petaseus NBRC 106054]
MNSFDDLKEIWQSSDEPGLIPLHEGMQELAPLPAETTWPVVPVLPRRGKSAFPSRNKLERQLKFGAASLFITGLFVFWLGYFSGIPFQSKVTYAGVVVIGLVCWAQSVLLLFTWLRLHGIDETALPAVHLQQWEAYYRFRRKQAAWNVPLYFIALNLGMGLYCIEIFSGRKPLNVALFLLIYGAWMIIAYFVIGKRNLRNEDARLKSILDNVRDLKQQFDKEEVPV